MSHCLSNTCHINQSKVRVKCCAHTAGLSMSDQTAWPWPWSDWFDMCLTDSIKYLRSQDSLMYMRLELVLSETGWRNFALYSYLWRGGTSKDTFDVYQMIDWTTTLYNVNSFSWCQNNTYNVISHHSDMEAAAGLIHTHQSIIWRAAARWPFIVGSGSKGDILVMM